MLKKRAMEAGLAGGRGAGGGSLLKRRAMEAGLGGWTKVVRCSLLKNRVTAASVAERAEVSRQTRMGCLSLRSDAMTPWV